LDRLDVGILKILLLNNGVPPGVPVLRKSFRSIARDLGVDQGTVRSRMRRFQASGILRGWYLGVSPGLTGHDLYSAWLGTEGPVDRSAAIDALLSDPNIERVCDYLGPQFSLILFAEKGADLGPAVRRLTSRAGFGVRLLRERLVRVPLRRLKPTDSSIIACLQTDPWKPYSIVADEVGVSAKTVARRVAAMSEEGLIYLLPSIDLRALTGMIPVELVVQYRHAESKARVNELLVPRLREGLVFSDTSGSQGYFALFVSNIAQMVQLAEWVSRQEGVLKVHTDVLQDVLLNRNHYESQRFLLQQPPPGFEKS